MQEELQKTFSNIARIHNITITEIARLSSLIEEEDDDEKKWELEKQKIFWGRMKYAQKEQVGEVIHEAVRQKENLILENNIQLVTLIDFFAERGIEGHKVVDVSPKFQRNKLLDKFLNAYCNENRYLMNSMKYELIK